MDIPTFVREFNITIRLFAAWVGRDERQVYRWLNGEWPVPSYVTSMMAMALKLREFIPDYQIALGDAPS